MNKVIQFLEKHAKVINITAHVVATVGTIWVSFTEQDVINPFLLSAVALAIYFLIPKLVFIADVAAAAYITYRTDKKHQKQGIIAPWEKITYRENFTYHYSMKKYGCY